MHQRMSVKYVVLLAAAFAPWFTGEMTAFSPLHSVHRNGAANDCDGAAATEDTAVESLKMQLPSVDWDEVLPGRILPIVNLSVDELRQRFGDEHSRYGLMELLGDDRHWTPAHVVLTALYCTEREDASTVYSRYRSKRNGRTTDVDYNGLALQIEYEDDGYCIKKTVRIPSRREQQTKVQAAWDMYFRFERNRRIAQSQDHERTAHAHWLKLLSGREIRVGKQERDRFRNTMVENGGVKWATAGFGPMVPVFSDEAKEYLQQDERIAIAAAYSFLEDDEVAVIAHVVLLTRYDPRAIVRLPQNIASDSVTIDAGGIDVQFAAGKGLVPSYLVERQALHLVRSHWDEVFKSLNINVIID